MTATKKTKIQELVLIALPILAIIITAVLYNKMPEQVPALYSLSGEVSKFAEKSFVVFLIPVLSLLYYFYFLIIPKIGLYKENYQLFKSSYNIIRLAGSIVLFITNIIIILSIFYPTNNEWAIALKVFIAVSLLVFGDRLPKIKKNCFLGIVNPWTLKSNIVWYKTQKFTGKFIVSVALILLILSFINYEWSNAIYISLLLSIIILPHIYSANKYFIKKQTSKGDN